MSRLAAVEQKKFFALKVGVGRNHCLRKSSARIGQDNDVLCFAATWRLETRRGLRRCFQHGTTSPRLPQKVQSPPWRFVRREKKLECRVCQVPDLRFNVGGADHGLQKYCGPSPREKRWKRWLRPHSGSHFVLISIHGDLAVEIDTTEKINMNDVVLTLCFISKAAAFSWYKFELECLKTPFSSTPSGMPYLVSSHSLGFLIQVSRC